MVVVVPIPSKVAVVGSSVMPVNAGFTVIVIESHFVLSLTDLAVIVTVFCSVTLAAFTVPLLTVATELSLDSQVTPLSVAVSGNTVAVSSNSSPAVIVAVSLALSPTFIVTSVTGTVAAFTVTVQVAVCSPAVAVMVTLLSPVGLIAVIVALPFSF